MNEIQEISKPQREAAYTVLRELRTHLTWEEFCRTLEKAEAADGYRLVGILENQKCVALMGYRILHDFVHGKHLYVDDLVVTSQQRSRGLGARLLKFAEETARAEGCLNLRLCTGADNDAGKRFYEREGWHLRAVAYKKPC